MPTTVLNVDDNAASRYLRTQVLRQGGFEVLEASSGQEALSIVNNLHPALVLLDVHLPDMNGFEVCRTIKNAPDGAAIPVLHISATAVEEQDLITGLQSADAYVVEPVPAEVLLAFVRALLRGRELLQQWVSVFDALTDGVALLSADGQVLRCNSAFCRLMHKRIGEVIGHSIIEVVSPDRCDPLESPFAKSLRTRQSETVECLFGENIYRLSSHLALVRGTVAGAIYIISDVTGERRAGREKEEAFALLRALTDAAPVGFVFFDREMRYRFVNKELAAINNLSIGAHLGRTPEEVMPIFAAEARRIFQQVMESGQPVLDHEFSGEAGADPGQTRSWSASWYPVRSVDDRLMGVGVTFLETTERKLAEKAREAFEKKMFDSQKLESIGLLAGGIAHDFNNLLTGVLGNASLGREMALSGTPLAKCLDEIINASERAAHLTKQMLAYSGKGRFVIETIDLSREANEVAQLVQPSISKKITLHLDLPENLPTIYGDKGQMHQIVMNLVVNAAEAIGDAPGLLSIRTGVRDLDEQYIHETLAGPEIDTGTYVYLEVSDTGRGMDNATKAKIFDPFFTTKFTGRGLGLSAVSGILRSHKGAIHVNSTVGQGSTFLVLFPAVGSIERAPSTQASNDGLRETGGTGTILIVDDEEVVLRTARVALERQGYKVMLADSGLAAIELFRQHASEIALIILDLSMPGMSGEEILPALRKVRSDIPVLVSSGYSESEAMRVFSGQHITGFLQKPYTALRLGGQVKSALRGASQPA